MLTGRVDEFTPAQAALVDVSAAFALPDDSEAAVQVRPGSLQHALEPGVLGLLDRVSGLEDGKRVVRVVQGREILPDGLRGGDRGRPGERQAYELRTPAELAPISAENPRAQPARPHAQLRIDRGFSWALPGRHLG